MRSAVESSKSCPQLIRSFTVPTEHPVKTYRMLTLQSSISKLVWGPRFVFFFFFSRSKFLKRRKLGTS